MTTPTFLNLHPRSKGALTAFALATAAALALAVGAGAADANTAYVETASFGTAGAGAGALNGPTGITIEQSTGDVYVLDSKNLRVQKFTANGQFILAFGKEVDETKVNEGDTAEANICTAASGDACKAGANGDEPGELGNELFFGFIHNKGPTGIASDPETGDIYVADRYNRRIEKFSLGGVYLSQLDGGGTPAGSFSEPSPQGVDAVAVDPAPDTLHGGHDLYVADSGNDVIDVFDAAGTYLRQLETTTEGALSAPDGVAFDAAGDAYVLGAGGSVYVFHDGEGTGKPVALEEALAGPAESIAVDNAGDIFIGEQHGEATRVVKFSATGKLLATQFGSSSGNEPDPFGVAVTASGKQAYLTGGYGAGEANQRAWLYEEETGTPPSASTGKAGSVTATGVTLKGMVDPEGAATTYWFEYGSTETYGDSTPHEPAGSGTSTSEATATLEDLAPSETYHYRLVAESAFGVVDGSDETFTTPGVAPSVGRQFTELKTQTGVRLLANINAENQDTHYYFQYGTDPTLTSNVSTMPAPPGEDLGSELGERTAEQNIEGLTPATTYYYRVVAENATGTAENVPIESFSTNPLAPSASNSEPGEITDTTATLGGTVDGMGADTHYYFAYGPSTSYGSEAPNPAEDAGVTSSATAVSTTLTGLTPNTTYHYQLTVYNVCEFFNCPAAGQIATAADMTFTTLASPPVAVADASGGNISPNSATLTGSADLNGVTGSYHFDYGPTAAYGSATPDGTLAASVLGQPVNADIAGLAPDTTYHYRLVVTSNGGTDFSPDQTFTTYTTAPAVATGQATSVASTTATLGGSLNPQGAATTYWFQYGTTTAYSTSVPAGAADAGAGEGFQSVTQIATGLTPGTTYHFRLVTNNAGGSAYGADQTFTTAPAAAPAAAVTSPAPNATTGKAGTAPAPAKPLTAAQKLAKALKACARKPKHERPACVRQARRRYAPVKKPRT
jgi:phosphodiesterase/alkaline phosphatase D-like protein